MLERVSDVWYGDLYNDNGRTHSASHVLEATTPVLPCGNVNVNVR